MLNGHEFRTGKHQLYLSLFSAGLLLCHAAVSFEKLVLLWWINDAAHLTHYDIRYIFSAEGHIFRLTPEISSSSEYCTYPLGFSVKWLTITNACRKSSATK